MAVVSFNSDLRSEFSYSRALNCAMSRKELECSTREFVREVENEFVREVENGFVRKVENEFVREVENKSVGGNLESTPALLTKTKKFEEKKEAIVVRSNSK